MPPNMIEFNPEAFGLTVGSDGSVYGPEDAMRAWAKHEQAVLEAAAHEAQHASAQGRDPYDGDNEDTDTSDLNDYDDL